MRMPCERRTPCGAFGVVIAAAAWGALLGGCGGRTYIDVKDPGVVLYKSPKADQSGEHRWLRSLAEFGGRDWAQIEEWRLAYNEAKNLPASPATEKERARRQARINRTAAAQESGQRQIEEAPPATLTSHDEGRSPENGASGNEPPTNPGDETPGPNIDITNLRNAIARAHLADIEQYHEAYSMSLHLRIANGKSAFDVTNLGLTFAGTVVGGEAAKTVLSAVATLTQGTELALEENFLNKQASLALISQMIADRNEQRTLIEENLKESDARYDLSMVDRDLTRYFASSSLINAIVSLSKEAAENQRGSEEQLAKAKAVESRGFSDTPAGRRLDAWARRDEANMEKLRGWLKAKKIDDPAEFWPLSSATSTPLLEEALNDLGVEG